MLRFSESLIDFASWFHNFGVEYLKDHVTKVWYLNFGMCSMIPVLLKLHVVPYVVFYID